MELRRKRDEFSLFLIAFSVRLGVFLPSTGRAESGRKEGRPVVQSFFWSLKRRVSLASPAFERKATIQVP